MAHLSFTINLARQTACPEADISATTIAQLFDQYFALWPEVRSYILDDQGSVRKHIRVIIDGINLRDRQQLNDSLEPNSEVFVFQALSGG